MLPIQGHAANSAIAQIDGQQQAPSAPAPSTTFRGHDYSALLANDSFASKLGRKVYYTAVGEEGIKKMLSEQYDMLAKNSTTLQDFFPADQPKYKEVVLSHQMPFFQKYFNGTLTESDLEKFDNAHHRFSHALGRQVQISHQQFDDMKHLVDSNAGVFMRFLTTPSNAIEPFRSLVVTDTSAAAAKEPSVQP